MPKRAAAARALSKRARGDGGHHAGFALLDGGNDLLDGDLGDAQDAPAERLGRVLRHDELLIVSRPRPGHVV